MPEKQASKEELAEKLRNLLGTDIRFENLSKTDLVKLLEIFTVVGKLAQVAVKSKAMILEERIGEGAKEVFSKPFTLRDIIKRRRELIGQGPFGLGRAFLKGVGLEEEGEEEPQTQTE